MNLKLGARDLLRTWRDNNDRKSEEIIYIWKSVLEYNLNKLGNESRFSKSYTYTIFYLIIHF